VTNPTNQSAQIEQAFKNVDLALKTAGSEWKEVSYGSGGRRGVDLWGRRRIEMESGTGTRTGIGTGIRTQTRTVRPKD
jgi:hypothetical protein